MRHVKHGVSLVAVLIALFVASFGGTLSELSTDDQSGVSIDSTYSVTPGDSGSDADADATRGLHW